MQPHDDATDLPGSGTDAARAHSAAGLDRLDRARERLVRWREALEAAGFRTNLSLMPPCSLAARRGDASDEHWVTVLPTGLVALERGDRAAGDATWSRAAEHDREPTIDDVLQAVRALIQRSPVRPRTSGASGHSATKLGPVALPPLPSAVAPAAGPQAGAPRRTQP